ncbi:MAG: hypothetical protein ACHQRJ_24885 [Alphaproteobacteria bacterium]
MAKTRRVPSSRVRGTAAPLPRAVVIHSLAHAKAALAAASAEGVAVELWSAEGAAANAGAGWFKAVLEAARREVPGARSTAVLDCADLPGYALGAFRIGVEAVCFSGAAKIAAKLADIAAQEGRRCLRRRPRGALDLGHAADPFAACQAWLRGQRRGRTPAGR